MTRGVVQATWWPGDGLCLIASGFGGVGTLVASGTLACSCAPSVLCGPGSTGQDTIGFEIEIEMVNGRLYLSGLGRRRALLLVLALRVGRTRDMNNSAYSCKLDLQVWLEMHRSGLPNCGLAPSVRRLQLGDGQATNVRRRQVAFKKVIMVDT